MTTTRRHAAHPPRLRTAALAAADAAERRRSAGRYAGGLPDTVTHTPGTGPCLVTAPHATAHLRDDVRKVADLGTGLLAELVAAATGAHALVADGLQTRDGNYHPDGAFKDALVPLLKRVRYVLDIHGMADRHGVDVCLGLGPDPDRAAALHTELEPALTAAGFTVAVNTPFDATTPHTVTSTAQRAGVSAIQVELSAAVRWAGTGPDRRLAVVAALAGALSRLPL